MSTSPTAPKPRTWKVREIRRLGELPLDTDDPAPARVEACICRLLGKVKDWLGDEKISVTEEEDAVLKDIQRCEGQGRRGHHGTESVAHGQEL